MASERGHDLKSAYVRHVKVEQDQVRRLIATQRHDQRGVAGRLDVRVSGVREEVLERHDRHLVVIDDEDPHVLQRELAHVGTASAQAAGPLLPSMRCVSIEAISFSSNVLVSMPFRR